MPSLTVPFLTAVVLAASSSASAQEGALRPAPSAASPELSQWSITLSPIHLAIGPIAEVTGERRITPKVGAALLLGYGTLEDSDGPSNTFDVFEVGVSGRYYLLGDFDGGLQLGASAEYIKVSGDDINGSGSSAVADGLALSPFVGYKHVWSFGLTFDGQIGPAMVVAKAEADDGSTAEESDVSVNLNLNVGWSF